MTRATLQTLVTRYAREHSWIEAQGHVARVAGVQRLHEVPDDLLAPLCANFIALL